MKTGIFIGTWGKYNEKITDFSSPFFFFLHVIAPFNITT